MAERFTFPQTGDNDDAEHFGSLIGQANLSNYIETGLDLQNYNAAGPDIDVTTGKCYISQSSETASSSGDTILQTNSIVQIPAVSTLALTDSAVNEIYVDPDFGTDDNGTVNATTTGVPSGSLKIGEVDTSADTVDVDFNREPTISVDTITDRNGNTVYDGAQIPVSRITQGSGSGLDADTVDGIEAADLSADNTQTATNYTTVSFSESYTNTGESNASFTLSGISPPVRYWDFTNVSVGVGGGAKLRFTDKYGNTDEYPPNSFIGSAEVLEAERDGFDTVELILRVDTGTSSSTTSADLTVYEGYVDSHSHNI